MKPPLSWMTLQRLHRRRISWRPAEFDTTGRSFEQAPTLTTSTTRFEGTSRKQIWIILYLKEAKRWTFRWAYLGPDGYRVAELPLPRITLYGRHRKLISRLKELVPALRSPVEVTICWRLTVPLKAKNTRLFAYSRGLGKEVGNQDPIGLWLCRFYRTRAQYTFHENECDYPVLICSLT